MAGKSSLLRQPRRGPGVAPAPKAPLGLAPAPVPVGVPSLAHQGAHAPEAPRRTTDPGHALPAAHRPPLALHLRARETRSLPPSAPPMATNLPRPHLPLPREPLLIAEPPAPAPDLGLLIVATKSRWEGILVCVRTHTYMHTLIPTHLYSSWYYVTVLICENYLSHWLIVKTCSLATPRWPSDVMEYCEFTQICQHTCSI